MKKIIFKLLALYLIVIFAFSCTQKCNIYIEKPNDLKGIDREGYNDVYNVFWHYFSNNCRGAGYPTGHIIKIYGRIDTTRTNRSGYSFKLVDIYERENNHNYDLLYNKYNYRAPSLRIFNHFSDELLLREKLANSDLTKIAYITGEIITIMLAHDGPSDNCCFVIPAIRIYSIDDIYFETD